MRAAAGATAAGPPYPASWLDGLVARVERLPGPAWAAYLVALALFALLNNVVFWLDGSLAPGTFVPIRAADAFFIVYFAAIYHHLSVVAGRCLREFEPLLDVSDPERAAIRWRLTKVPRRVGWLAALVGIANGVATVLMDPAGVGVDVARTPLPFVFQGLTLSFVVSALGVLAVQVLRQLSIVSALHRRAVGIDLFHLRPTHAFATLTARAGSVLLVFVLVNLVIQATLTNGAPLSAMLLAGSLAVLAFTLPLLGLRERLKEERQRALERVDDGIKTTLARIQDHVESGRHDDVSGLNTSLNALLTSRKVVAGISTWPWESETVRSFVSTLLLPIAVWLITRLLDRVV